MAFVRRETTLLLSGDAILLVISLWLALLFRNLETPLFGYFLKNFVPFIPIFLLSLVIFYIAGLYEKQTRLVKRVMGIRILGAQISNVLIAAVIFFLLPLTIAPKTILALYLVVSVVLVSMWRFYLAPYVVRGTRRPALLVASGPAATEVYEEVNGNTRYTLIFTEYLDMTRTTSEALVQKIEEAIGRGVEFIVLDTRDSAIRALLPRLYEAMLEGATFTEFSSFYEDLFDRVPLEHIDHAWLLERLPHQNIAYGLLKRAFDIIAAATVLLIALLFIIPAALVLSFGGAAFIFHDRIGKDEKSFRIIKLRTMLTNDHGNPELQKKNRVTPFGKFLRRTRIDELPQLWNVFVGDVSFIGPRPELPSIAAVYEREIPYYHVRHMITPGLSGWAQIYDYDAPRGPADIEKTRRKLSYDLYYLRHRSFGLDLSITLKTLRALLSFSGT